MTRGPTERLRTRPDYTFRFHPHNSRHGWLRLTPAYSVKIVEKVMEEYTGALSVLDPFCGTGTTALSAASRGHQATTTDINPFLVWLARCKTAYYSKAEVADSKQVGNMVADLALGERIPPAREPPMRNIERWWDVPNLRFLCFLKAAIRHLSRGSGPVFDLLSVAFCRTLISLSNASHNHQSLSFSTSLTPRLMPESPPGSIFLDELALVLQGAQKNPLSVATVEVSDARNLPLTIGREIDLIVTSPPYANRMTYIRELRPYMYWLGFLTDGHSAGKLDWEAIGGTWGIATSRLSNWTPDEARWVPKQLGSTVDRIARSHPKNGPLMANYVAKYVEDMSSHFETVRYVLRPSARVHYIVGNSTFYDVLVPTEAIYARLMQNFGYQDIRVEPIRKRNSKRALYEYEVSATWPGP